MQINKRVMKTNTQINIVFQEQTGWEHKLKLNLNQKIKANVDTYLIDIYYWWRMTMELENGVFVYTSCLSMNSEWDG